MKKLLLFISFFILHYSLFAQSWLWGKQGTTNSDTWAVAADTKGNSFIAGSYLYNIAFDTNHLTTTGKNGSYLVKYDSTGNIKWIEQPLAASSASGGITRVVTVDDSNNIYALGAFFDTLSFAADTVINTSSSYVAMYLVKYDNNGKVFWVRQSKCNTAASFTKGWAVATDKAGNVYVAGSFADSITLGTFTLTTASAISEMFLAKYSYNGILQWVKQSGSLTSACNATAQSVSADTEGNIYVTGGFKDTISFGAFTIKSSALNVFLAKYNAAGSEQWVTQSTCVGSTNGEGYSVITDKEGNPYITGYFYDSIYFGTTKLVGAKYTAGIFLAKYNNTGKLTWAEQSSPSAFEWYGYSLTRDDNDNLYFSGGTTNIGNTVTLGGLTLLLDTASTDAGIIMKLDTSGKAECGSIICTGADDQNAVACSPSGKYIYLGSDAFAKVIFNKDTINGGINEPPFIARWQPCTNPQSVTDITPQQNNSVTLYPNPNRGVFTLQWLVASGQLSEKNRVEIYNMLGEKIYSQCSIPTTQISIDIRNHPAGIYMYRVIGENGESLATGKFVIE